MKKNPFSINFGMLPLSYIERDLVIDEIVAELESEQITNPCFILTGIRGSGKTVTMTAIERIFQDNSDWIIIRLNPDRDMLESLVSKLYDSHRYIQKFMNTQINLSAFGIGIALKSTPPIADIESALEIILREVKKQNKRLLVTVDEVSNTDSMRKFASSFQILIRQELPIFLIMAGLYENIHQLENEKNLTFLYRTPKYEMDPLSAPLIRIGYQSTLNIPPESADKMAKITMGYPFAYQVLGKYIWESKDKCISDEVLAKFDAALEKYVYSKIWSELSETDRFYMRQIAEHDSITTADLLKSTNKKQNEFSQYRARLRDKGLIDVSKHGKIQVMLPRFKEFIDNHY